MAAKVRVGIGGWTFAPWRGNFYPQSLRQKDELSYAAGHLTAIEINGTYYSGFSPATFAKWAAETPDGFVFSVKASRFCTNRRVLADGADSVNRFLTQGLVELGDRLGPILWQFMPTKAFDRDDMARFLDLLPPDLSGRRLRHVLEVRHDSFHDSRFIDLARERSVAVCLADHATYPMIEALTADFVYARLMQGKESNPTCYPPEDIAAWARRFADLAAGDPPREVFAFFITGGKPRAPAGAMAMIEALGAIPRLP